MPKDGFSSEERARYGRHFVLPEVGERGQTALANARVLIVGAGGLGSPAALYLAAAGIGEIGLIDPDHVDRSNLQRQILFVDDDVGESKVRVGAERLRAINPHVTVNKYAMAFDASNALDLVTAHDVVVDGSDNFATRYLVNDACVLAGRPDVYGSVLRFEGQLSVFWAGRGPCYRCIFPAPPPADEIPNCADGGVLGVLPGTIGSWQATEAIKIVLDAGDVATGRLLHYDALAMRIHTFTIPRESSCPVCGDAPTITSIAESVAATRAALGTEACGGPTPSGERAISPATLEATRDACVLIDIRGEADFARGHVPDSLSIPAGDLARSLDRIDRGAHVVVVCKMGVRSRPAARYLREQGFERVSHLEGGYDAWVLERTGAES